MNKFLATLILLTSVSLQAKTCDWNNPGSNPYTGNLTTAVDSYAELSPEAKKAIKTKLASNAYDDHVQITKDSVIGKEAYTGLRDMHWSKGKCTGDVDTSKWKQAQNVVALVYCHKEQCIIRPQICNNIALIDKIISKGSKTQSDGFTPEVDTLTTPEPIKASESVLAIPKTDVSLPQVLVTAGEESFSDKLLPWLGLAAGLFGGSAVISNSLSGGSNLGVVNEPQTNIPVVTAVPEPSTYAMILAGLVFIGFIYFKRKKQAC